MVAPTVPELKGASVVIWTTTPWTMPGNRAIACGAEFDYAVVRMDSAREGSLALAGEVLVVALALLPQTCEAVGVATHHVLHIVKGERSPARSAPTRCAGAATTTR